MAVRIYKLKITNGENLSVSLCLLCVLCVKNSPQVENLRDLCVNLSTLLRRRSEQVRLFFTNIVIDSKL